VEQDGAAQLQLAVEAEPQQSLAVQMERWSAEPRPEAPEAQLVSGVEHSPRAQTGLQVPEAPRASPPWAALRQASERRERAEPPLQGVLEASEPAGPEERLSALRQQEELADARAREARQQLPSSA